MLDIDGAFSTPQARARGMVVEVESPFGGKDRQPGRPLKFPESGEGVSPEEPPRRPPHLGEHNEMILEEIGYTTGQIEDLRKKGVIRGK